MGLLEQLRAQIRRGVIPVSDLQLDRQPQGALVFPDDLPPNLAVLSALVKGTDAPIMVRVNADGTIGSSGGGSKVEVTSDGTTVIGVPSSPLITELQDGAGNQQGTSGHPLFVTQTPAASAPLGDSSYYFFAGTMNTSSAFNVVPNVGGKKFRTLTISVSVLTAATLVLEWPGNVQFIGWDLAANGTVFVDYSGTNGILAPATGDGVFGLNTGTTATGFITITGQYE